MNSKIILLVALTFCQPSLSAEERNPISMKQLTTVFALTCSNKNLNRFGEWARKNKIAGQSVQDLPVTVESPDRAGAPVTIKREKLQIIVESTKVWRLRDGEIGVRGVDACDALVNYIEQKMPRKTTSLLSFLIPEAFAEIRSFVQQNVISQVLQTSQSMAIAAVQGAGTFGGPNSYATTAGAFAVVQPQAAQAQLARVEKYFPNVMRDGLNVQSCAGGQMVLTSGEERITVGRRIRATDSEGNRRRIPRRSEAGRYLRELADNCRNQNDVERLNTMLNGQRNAAENAAVAALNNSSGAVFNTQIESKEEATPSPSPTPSSEVRTVQ